MRRNNAKNGLNTLFFVLTMTLANTASAYDQMTVNYLKVGPGNCVLINCPTAAVQENVNLLLDCGSHNNGVFDLAPEVVIELANGHTTNVILSHSDKDHHNYLPSIFGTDDRPKMGSVYMGDKSSLYGETESFVQIHATDTIYGRDNINSNALIQIPASSKEVRETIPETRKRQKVTYNYQQINRLDIADLSALEVPPSLNNCGLADVRILAGNSKTSNWGTSGNTNEQSLVVSVSWADRHFIFPGDATNTDTDLSLKKALKRWALVRGEPIPSNFSTPNVGMQVDVMMAAHHGSDQKASNWAGWANVTRPDFLIFSGDPANSNASYRHPKEAAYNPYKGQLEATALHSFQTGIVNSEKYIDAITGVNKAYTNHLLINEAAFTTAQLDNIEVTVYPKVGDDAGELEVGCSADWCGTKFLTVVDNLADKVVITEAGTEIQAIDNAGDLGSDHGKVKVTLLDKNRNPVKGVFVEFVAIRGRANLVPVSGITDANGRFIAEVEGVVGGAVDIEAIYDSNSDSVPDKRVINGSPATVNFATGG